ncbi:type II toxin-antitoxin system PemK/MazF family toxin [Micrococcaceae bacterium Sec5.7]
MAINLRSIGTIVRTSLRFLGKLRPTEPGRTADPHVGATQRPADPGTPGTGAGLSAGYPGDFAGTSTIRYAPSPDGSPDPGEVVWTWVPYEEDYSRGKDRPVLLIGGSGRYLLGLMLTSKDHDQGHRGDNDFVDIGTGGWDRQGRPGEARLDRVLQIRVQDIRREGAVLDRARFDPVAAGMRRRHGWS